MHEKETRTVHFNQQTQTELIVSFRSEWKIISFSSFHFSIHFQNWIIFLCSVCTIYFPFSWFSQHASNSPYTVVEWSVCWLSDCVAFSHSLFPIKGTCYLWWKCCVVIKWKIRSFSGIRGVIYTELENPSTLAGWKISIVEDWLT